MLMHGTAKVKFFPKVWVLPEEGTIDKRQKLREHKY
jgi:hypothetical protein